MADRPSQATEDHERPRPAQTRAAEMSAGTASAYEQIRQAIVEGRYRPSQRLVEQRVAEEFELSRTPVREALRLLQAEGLVQVEANRGAVVRSLTLADVADLYELRARLEAYSAERAAARVTPAQLDRIDLALDRFDEAVRLAATHEVTGLRDVSRWNNEFHGAIVEAAAHERLAAMVARTVDHPLVFQSFRQYDREQLDRSALFHRLIRDAIAQGDGQGAAHLMAAHIYQGRDTLLASIEQISEEPE